MGVAPHAMQHPPDDQDAFIQLTCPVPQRVLAVELQEDSNMIGCQPLLTTGELSLPPRCMQRQQRCMVGCQADVLTWLRLPCLAGS